MKNISINLNNKCNLRCKYCFVQKDNTTMTISVLLRSLQFSLSAQGTDISFFGTEPLLSWSKLSYGISWLKENYHGGRGGSGELHISLTTNGTLLTEDIASFLQQNHVQCLVSIDGKEEVHNLFRSHWRETVRGLSLLTDLPPMCLISVTPETLTSLPSTLEWLYTDFSILGVASNLVTTHHPTKFRVRDLRRGLMIYYEKVMELGVKDHYWEKVLPYLRDPNLIMSRRTCGAAHGSIGIDWNGDIYPCHKRWGETIGSVFGGIQLDKVGAIRKFDYRQCNGCIVRFCAPCYEENEWLTGDAYVVGDYTCMVEAVRWETVNRIWKDHEN